MKDNFLSRYTPRIMPAEVLEQIFVQREPLAQELVERIREGVLTHTFYGEPAESVHHTLLIGPRGIGKTHLVSLVYHRIREMEDLEDSLLVAWLSEDEWSVTSFLDLLLCILSALPIGNVEDLYELPAEEAEAEGVKRLKELIGNSFGCEEDPSPTGDEGEGLSRSASDLPASPNNSRTLLLIVENLDELFTGLGKAGQASLREFLAETNCVILATSQCELKEIQQKKSPFYGFFDCEQLKDLSASEATQLLANIAKYKGNEQLASFIETPTGRSRINAVHFLAGGNPRIYVIFSEFLASRESLDELTLAFMAMLDDLTPYYQERMKNVSPQQRKIVDILVRSGHAITVKEIAKAGFMTHQTASSQLKKLLEMSYVRTESYGREAFYELREPLMRFCLKAKRQRGEPIKLIIDFLRRWYTRSELQERLELLGGEARLEREYLLGAIQAYEDDDKDPRVVACGEEFGDCIEKEDYVSALQQAEKLVVIRGNEWDWSAQGLCLDKLEQYEQAIASYYQALSIQPDYYFAWYFRSIALDKLGRYEEAIASYDKALSIQPNKDEAWYNRGIALCQLERYEEAVVSCDKALSIQPDFHLAWNLRGIALDKLGQYEEALASWEKAIELGGQYSYVFFRPELAALIIRNLFKNSQDPAIWKTHLTSLITLYNKYQALSTFAQGLVQSIPMLMSEMVSQKAAQVWLEIWQELGSYPEFQIPLRLLATAVRYREKSDPRVLLDLPIEERKLLEGLLKDEQV